VELKKTIDISLCLSQYSNCCGAETNPHPLGVTVVWDITPRSPGEVYLCFAKIAASIFMVEY
jgi:hypothetical protein